MPRPKQSVAALKASGSRHYSKDELAEKEAREPKPPVPEKAKAPKYLKGTLKEKFEYLADILIRTGIFSELDTDSLSRYVIAEGNYLTATQKLTAAVSSGNTGEAEKWSSMQDRFFKQCRASAADLGLTVSGRCRLELPVVPEPSDGLEDDLFGD